MKGFDRLRRMFPLALTATLILAAGACSAYPNTTFSPHSDFGRDIDALWNRLLLLGTIVFILVEGALIFVVLRYRHRGDTGRPPQTHGSTNLEILWTLIPAVILVFIAVPTVRTVFKTQAKAAANALQVEVIGHQWWWEFRYPEYGVVTANELHVPTGRPVDLVMHSADVVHSFWIPRLGGKRDVNPQPATTKGEKEKVNHIVFTPEVPGDYSGQCAEFCGDSHAVMRVRGEVDTPEDFQSWVTKMKTPAEPDSGSVEAQGKQIFTTHACVACHTLTGTTAQGQVGPNLTRVGARHYVGAGIL